MLSYPQNNVFHIEHVRPIGAGGLGTVDEVVVTASYPGGPARGTRYARKRLGPQWGTDPTQRERFEREIEQMWSMDHRYIVKLRGENCGGERFYIMDLYPLSLRDFLQARPGPIERRGAVEFCIKIADALRYAHQLGFVHRDLKPENILLDEQFEPAIADWGLGRFIHRQSKVLNLTVGGMGTMYYCSAEQWANGSGTPQSDIYSLGMMLAEMVNGGMIHLQQTGLGVQEDVLVPSTPSDRRLNLLLRSMTHLLAQRRPANMAVVISELRTCLS